MNKNNTVLRNSYINTIKISALTFFFAVSFMLTACNNGNIDIPNEEYASIATTVPMIPTETTVVPLPTPTTTALGSIAEPVPMTWPNPNIPFLWHVTSPSGQTMYMFGTIHYGIRDFFPLPQELMQAFGRSDYLAVEVPLFIEREWSNPATVMAITELDDYTEKFNELRSQAINLLAGYESRLLGRGITVDELYGLSIDVLSWLVRNIASTIAGTSTTNGMEVFFYERAMIRQMPVLYIECPAAIDERMQGASLTLNIRQLEISIERGISEHAETIVEYLHYWRNNDGQALLNTFIPLALTDLGDDELIAEMEYILYISRHPRMLESARQFMEDGKKVFFMVGATHLLLEGGLIDQLVELGYTVERIEWNGW